MKTILKKSSAALMAAALMATSAVSAYAADSTAADNNTATTNDLNNSDIIDSSKKGSITIHKYDITSATKDGVYTEGERKATGQADSTLESTMADYEVEGVEFTYLRCGNVETFSANLNGVRDIKLAYEVPEALCTILGLDSADSIDMTEASVAFKCGNTGLYHYTSQQINDALANLLNSNNKAAKDALEDYVTSNSSSVAMPLTNKDGYTTATNLDLGLYLVVETKVPEEVVTTVNPWFIQLPFTNTSEDVGDAGKVGGARWLYDMVCYPKNQTGNPTLDKLVRNATGQVADTVGDYEDNSLLVYNSEDETKNKGLAKGEDSTYVSDRGGYTEGNNVSNVKQSGAADKIDSNDYGYASTTTASSGDVLDYILVSKLPHIQSKATYLSRYNFVDTLSEGLTYNEDARIAFYVNEEDAVVNNTANAVEIWSANSNYQQSYVDVQTGMNKATGQTTMSITFTDAGLNKINTTYSDYYIVVYYTATVNSDSTLVLGDDGNPNDVVLTWERTSQNFYNTLEDRCYVYSYGIDLTKKFSDAQGDMSRVKFNLYDQTDDYYVIANKTEIVDGEKVYYMTGKTTNQSEATVFTPDANGHFNIRGLEGDIYQLTEIETDDGYSLLKDQITINIKTASREITPAVAGYVGNTGGATHTHTDACYAKDAGGNKMQYTAADGSKEDILICGYSDGDANGRTIGKVAMAVGPVVKTTATVDGTAVNLANYSITEATTFDGTSNAASPKVLSAINVAPIDSEDALVELEITNSKGFLLPQTGGAGMIVATATGIVICAAGCYMVAKKKNKKTENTSN